MCIVLRLRHEEPVRLDGDQLRVLFQQYGPAGADRIVTQALEELILTLARATQHYRAGEIEALGQSVKALIAVAQHVGMTSLARVGRDVLFLTQGGDDIALGACMARLERISETSMVAVWDIEGLSV